jgi:hypothetical protein
MAKFLVLKAPCRETIGIERKVGRTEWHLNFPQRASGKSGDVGESLFVFVLSYWLSCQSALHRGTGSCASCHALFDPYGFALESFDVTGQYRKNGSSG